MYETQVSRRVYEPFSEAFYTAYENDPEIIARAYAVRDAYNRALKNLGFTNPGDLPKELQDFLEEETNKVLELGAHHD